MHLLLTEPKSLLGTQAMLLTQQTTSVVIQLKRCQLANPIHCFAVFPVATFSYDPLMVVLKNYLLQKSLLKLMTLNLKEVQQVPAFVQGVVDGSADVQGLAAKQEIKILVHMRLPAIITNRGGASTPASPRPSPDQRKMMVSVHRALQVCTKLNT